jgi:TM2 domain-containing membrane protein YozV
MGNWISSHTHRWPIFVIAAVLLSVLISRAHRTKAGRSIPGLFLLVWFGGLVALYLDFKVDRLRAYAPHLWSGQVATLAFVIGVPLALLVLTFVLWKRLARAALWRTGATLAGAVGIAAMSLAPTISLWMFHALRAWTTLDHPHQ